MRTYLLEILNLKGFIRETKQKVPNEQYENKKRKVWRKEGEKDENEKNEINEA